MLLIMFLLSYSNFPTGNSRRQSSPTIRTTAICVPKSSSLRPSRRRKVPALLHRPTVPERESLCNSQSSRTFLDPEQWPSVRCWKSPKDRPFPSQVGVIRESPSGLKEFGLASVPSRRVDDCSAVYNKRCRREHNLVENSNDEMLLEECASRVLPREGHPRWRKVVRALHQECKSILPSVRAYCSTDRGRFSRGFRTCTLPLYGVGKAISTLFTAARNRKPRLGIVPMKVGASAESPSTSRCRLIACGSARSKPGQRGS